MTNVFLVKLLLITAIKAMNVFSLNLHRRTLTPWLSIYLQLTVLPTDFCCGEKYDKSISKRTRIFSRSYQRFFPKVRLKICSFAAIL